MRKWIVGSTCVLLLGVMLSSGVVANSVKLAEYQEGADFMSVKKPVEFATYQEGDDFMSTKKPVEFATYQEGDDFMSSRINNA
ncbi:MAG: hypothetical protein ACXW1D_04960 [Halobacteriota archaeon]